MRVMKTTPENLTIAVTGASGVLFARHLLKTAEADARVKIVNFIASENALRVLAEEVGIGGRHNLGWQLLGKKSYTIQQQKNNDIDANTTNRPHPPNSIIVIHP